MNMTRHSHHRLSIAMLAIATLISTGCKTASWSMPGSKFFSWGREPDASLIASNSQYPDYPQSPAEKYEPNTVASIGSSNMNQSSSTNSGSLAAANSAAASPYRGYGGATNPALNAGLAAQANGYAVGPYGVGAAGQPTGPAIANNSTPNSNLAAGLPNPYGGSYAGSPSKPASASDIALPASLANALGNPALPSDNYAALPTAPLNMPPLPTGTVTQASFPSPPNIGLSSGTTTNPAIHNNLGAAMTRLPSAVSALPNESVLPVSTGGGVDTSVPTASVGGTTLNGFSPGTTGRNTGYNFGENSSAATTAQQPSASVGANPLLR